MGKHQHPNLPKNLGLKNLGLKKPELNKLGLKNLSLGIEGSVIAMAAGA